MFKLKAGYAVETFLLFTLALILLFITLEKYIIPNFGTCSIQEDQEICFLGPIYIIQEIINE